MNRAALRLRLFSLKNGGRLSCFGNFGYSLALAAHVRVLFKRSGRCRIDRHLAPVDVPVGLRVQRTIARRRPSSPAPQGSQRPDTAEQIRKERDMYR